MKNTRNSSCESIYKFDEEKFVMVEFNIKRDFKQLDTKIKDLKLKNNILVAAILRGRNIIFPSGNDEIKLRDTVVLATALKESVKDINDILE